MHITPDSIIFWKWGFVTINATLVYTWTVMALIIFIAWIVSRRLVMKGEISRWQIALETIVSFARKELREMFYDDPEKYLPFLGTLFLFISVSNFLSFVPKFHPPTGSLATTGALATTVFFSVIIFGIAQKGIRGYIKNYFSPSVIMFPFNVIGEISRTVALAVRLFGNIMSGTLLVAILISLAPLFFPLLLHALELIIGQIQAYIFTVLSAVYISSAVRR